MSGIAREGVNQPTRSKVFLGVMIGPDMSGKTTFSRMAVDFFGQHFPDVDLDHFFYDMYCFSEIIYHLKNYAIASISDLQESEPERRKLILVDAKSMHDARYRLDIFQFCYMFDIIFLQIYLHFDDNEIIGRCANTGLFINPKMLKDPEFFNTSAIFSETRGETTTQWQINSITIFQSFIKNEECEFKRLYNFLFSCIAPPKNAFWNNVMARIHLEYDNPHKLQMQAGISYKDTLLHGKGNPWDEKKKEETSYQ